jgi:hypothetical protein
MKLLGTTIFRFYSSGHNCESVNSIKPASAQHHNQSSTPLSQARIRIVCTQQHQVRVTKPPPRRTTHLRSRRRCTHTHTHRSLSPRRYCFPLTHSSSSHHMLPTKLLLARGTSTHTFLAVAGRQQCIAPAARWQRAAPFISHSPLAANA